MITPLTIAKLSGTGAAVCLAEWVILALTDAVAISAITSVAGVIMAAVAAYFAYKAKVTAVETHAIVNSRMTEFMEMAKQFYRNEGKADEKADEKERQALKAQAVVEDHAKLLATKVEKES